MKTITVLLLCMVSCIISASNVNNQLVRPETHSVVSIPLVNNLQLRSSLPQLQSFPPVVVDMNPSYNNTTLSSISIAVPAQYYTYPPYTNIKYRFSITNVLTNTTAPDIIQTSRFVNIPASILAYNAQYTIKASAVINDEVLAYAGNTITVFTPSFPLITLGQAICGTTLASLTSTISANPGLNAISYTFRIRLSGDTTGTNYGYSTSSSQFVGANTFTGFSLSYGTSYSVAVQYTFPDPLTGLLVNSGYGGECTITTPKFPLIGLASPVCGSLVGTLNSNITASPAPYATLYQFRIRKTANVGGPYVESTPNASRFSSLSAFGITLAYNTSYSISVRYSISNILRAVWSGYGPECIIITPLSRASFKAKAYPNPFANNFMIDVATSSSSRVSFKVYDMMGRLIEQREVNTSEMETITIGDYYSSGLYNVVVSQENNIQSLMVVKR